MIRYEHTQPGYLMRWSLGGALMLVVALGALASSSSKPAPLIIPALVGFILAACIVLFHSLTAVVNEDEIMVSFGPGLIRRRIPISEIYACEVVRNKWYYGWGIKLIPHGWMFNVSGLNAVELTLRSGRKFRIGTDAPQELASAIRSAMTK